MRAFWLSALVVFAPVLFGGASARQRSDGSVEGLGVTGKDAWVFLASRCKDLVQALSSARTLRTVATRADIVIMTFG